MKSIWLVLTTAISVLFWRQDVVEEYSVIKFSSEPGEGDKQDIESVLRSRLSLLGCEYDGLLWREKSVYYKVTPYMDNSVLNKYVNVTGKLKLKKTDGTDLPDLSIEAIKSSPASEPNHIIVTFKLNRDTEEETVNCFVDEMKVAELNTNGLDSAEVEVVNSIEKLVRICHGSGAFPVKIDRILDESQYTEENEVWFPVSEELRRLLFENRMNFTSAEVIKLPLFFDYNDKGIFKFSNGKCFVVKINSRDHVVIDAIINMDRGFQEVAISNGAKLHESLLYSDAKIRELDLALTLAGIREGDLSDDSAIAEIFVQWMEGKEPITYVLEDLIIDIRLLRTMDKSGWRYQYYPVSWNDPVTGQAHEIPRFLDSGLIATTKRDDSSMFDTTFSDEVAMDDSRFVINSFLVPPVGTKVKVIIKRKSR